MGSPLSPIVANIFMESFEQQALDTAPHPPSLWKRYVDDTFVIQEEQHQEEFLQHINSIDPNIKFTAETTRADGSMPFLDTLVTPQSDGSLATTVYRNPLILISMYSGIATMPYQINSASSVLSYIGQRTFVPVNNFWMKNTP